MLGGYCNGAEAEGCCGCEVEEDTAAVSNNGGGSCEGADVEG